MTQHPTKKDKQVLVARCSALIDTSAVSPPIIPSPFR